MGDTSLAGFGRGFDGAVHSFSASISVWPPNFCSSVIKMKANEISNQKLSPKKIPVFYIE